MGVSIRETVVDLELSSICNLSCGFCPRDEIKRKNPFINDATIEQLAEHIDEDKIIWFSGMGEPFLHPDIIRIIKRLKETGTLVYTNTNGTSRQFRENVGSAVEAGIDFVNVSAYGTDAESYRRNTNRDVFSKVLEGISLLQIWGIPHRISYVVTEDTPENIRDILIKSYGVENVYLRRHYDRCFAASEQPIPKVCSLAQHYIFISSDGNVFSCVNDVKGVTNRGTDILAASKLKQERFPFGICGSCNYGGKDRKLSDGYFEAIRRLSQKE